MLLFLQEYIFLKQQFSFFIYKKNESHRKLIQRVMKNIYKKLTLAGSTAKRDFRTFGSTFVKQYFSSFLSHEESIVLSIYSKKGKKLN